MQTKILIAGTTLIVLLALYYLLIHNPKQATAPTTDETAMEESQMSTISGNEPTEDSAPGTTNGAVSTPKTGGVPTPPRTTSEPPRAAPLVVTVYYDGGSFVPETVTVIQGGTVVFENASDRPLWVGSNNHPTHAGYPVTSADDCLGSSFDACEVIGKGSTWSYTFSELGEWKYHNHMRPVDEGKVIVLTKENI